MNRGLEHISYEEKLRGLGLSSLEMTRHQGNLLVTFYYLKGNFKRDKGRLFSRAFCNKTRGSGFKLKEGRYKEEMFYEKRAEALQQVAQRGGGCLNPGNHQGQVG